MTLTLTLTFDEEPDVLFEDSKDIEFITEDYTSYQLELNSLIDSLLISKKINQNNLLKATAKAEMVLKSIFNLNNQNIRIKNFFNEDITHLNTVYRLPYILPLINNQLYQSYFKPLFNKKHNITIVQSKDPEKEFIEEIEKEIIQNEGESLALYKNRKKKTLQ